MFNQIIDTFYHILTIAFYIRIVSHRTVYAGIGILTQLRLYREIIDHWAIMNSPIEFAWTFHTRQWCIVVKMNSIIYFTTLAQVTLNFWRKMVPNMIQHLYCRPILTMTGEFSFRLESSIGSKIREPEEHKHRLIIIFGIIYCCGASYSAMRFLRSLHQRNAMHCFDVVPA